MTRAYWVDEGISVGISGHSLVRILGLLRMDGSPPLYYLVLHVWIRLFGRSEAATHGLSLLMSMALVPLGFWAADSLFSRTAGWCAAGLFASNPFLAWYSTETRMYVLVCGLALAAVTLSVRADRSASLRDAVMACGCFTALLYAHNWGAYLLVATAGVLGGKALFHRDRRRMTEIGAALIVVVATYLPWIPTLAFQVRHTAAPWAVRPELSDLVADPLRALAGPLASPRFAILAVIVLALVVRRTNRLRWPPSAVAVIIGIPLVADLLAWTVAQVKPSWALRYLAVSLGPLLLALAAGLSRSRRGRRTVLAGCVILGGYGFVSAVRSPAMDRYVKSNVAAIARDVTGALRPGDLVVATQTEQVPVLEHYFPAGLRYAVPTGPVADPTVVDWRDLLGRLRDATSCTTVDPLIAALPVGTNVLLVDPLEPIGATGSTWYRVVNTEAATITAYLQTDPALHTVTTYRTASSAHPSAGVTAELFTKTSDLSGCAVRT